MNHVVLDKGFELHQPIDTEKVHVRLKLHIEAEDKTTVVRTYTINQIEIRDCCDQVDIQAIVMLGNDEHQERTWLDEHPLFCKGVFNRETVAKAEAKSKVN